MHIYGFAKVLRWCSRKESKVFVKVLRNACRHDIRFQEIPRTFSQKIRDSSGIVTATENACRPWPMSWKQRVVSMILDIMKYVCKCPAKDTGKVSRKGKV